MAVKTIKLTTLASCAGCAAKVGQESLNLILEGIPPSQDPRLVVGNGDDAAVFEANAHTTLVQTLDFFPPIVDDPMAFGQIAAANALSDVYAMGGTPITAMNIVCFPVKKLGIQPLVKILRGGWLKLQEAGCALVGGHTVEDDEPKYGLSVTGLVDRRKVITIRGARPGDQLVLTKPLGMGIITTAHKRGKAPAALLRKAVEIMATLNNAASRVMVNLNATACTDITGYGLLGHAYRMADAGGVTLQFYSEEVPVLPEAVDLVRQGCFPGGSRANEQFLDGKLYRSSKVDPDVLKTLIDAQTSGGLLIAIPAGRVQDLVRTLREEGVLWARIVGEVKKQGLHPLVVV